MPVVHHRSTSDMLDASVRFKQVCL